MMFPAKILGVLVGMAAAAAVLWLMPGPSANPVRTGPPLSECDGALRSIVIQYAPSAQFVLPVYREFLRQLPADVVVHVMCPEKSAYDELVAQIGPVAAHLDPLIVKHEMTCWSRDRWVAFTPLRPGEPTTLLVPRSEAGAETWPQREGDQRLAFDLSALLGGDRVTARRSSLYFDGGDFLADSESVFVTANVIRQNVQNTVENIEQLKQELGKMFPGRKVILLENSPDHHAGMFMMSIGNRTVLVGDPSLSRGHAHPELPGGVDDSARTQAQFDSVAKTAADAGYHVVRIPVVPAMDGKTYLTYVNAVIDQRDGKRIVYMPIFRGAESLNDAAASVWRSVGYEVHPIDCTTTYRSFGNLHCLVNVLERS